MAKTLIKYLSQFLLLPLLEKLGKYIHNEIQQWRDKNKTEEIKKAQTPDEIRKAHRRSGRIDS